MIPVWRCPFIKKLDRFTIRLNLILLRSRPSLINETFQTPVSGSVGLNSGRLQDVRHVQRGKGGHQVEALVVFRLGSQCLWYAIGRLAVRMQSFIMR